MKVRIIIVSALVIILALLDVDGANLLEDELEIIDELGTKQVLSEEFSKLIVRRVIDGDTIELASGQIVRYIGIDAPETKHPQKGVECFGKEAAEYNKKLVEGLTIRMEKDVSETDRYGRLLRYVYVLNSEDGKEVFVNKKLVENGYALSSTYPPDVKYQDVFIENQNLAREKELGLWLVCE